MENKKKIFNYFLKEVQLKEQEHLNTKDEQLALIAVIFSSTHVFRRYQSGCNTEQIYFANPEYAEELFLTLCLDAEKHGDHLLKAFNFVPYERHPYGLIRQDLRDYELHDYLWNEVYPMAGVDYNLYATLMKTTPEEARESTSLITAYTRGVKTNLEISDRCQETEMIDRAWNRLMQNNEFVKLLQISAKHDNQCVSKAYKIYAHDYEYLLKCI